MAVDPKLVGGGAAVVAIGGGSGYAISKAASSSSDNNSSSSDQENNNENTLITSNRETLKNAGFSIDDTQAANTECKEKLKSKTITAGDNDDFKGLVEACYKNKKFSDKATSLGLEVLSTNNESDSGGETIGTPNKETMKTEVTGGTAKDWATAKEEVKTYCSTVNKGNKDINKNSTDTNGKNFLKACTKDKTLKESGKETKEVILTKDFGTGAVPATPKSA